MAIVLALAATIPASTIPVVVATSDEAGGDRKALDRLLDDACAWRRRGRDPTDSPPDLPAGHRRLPCAGRERATSVATTA